MVSPSLAPATGLVVAAVIRYALATPVPKITSCTELTSKPVICESLKLRFTVSGT